MQSTLLSHLSLLLFLESSNRAAFTGSATEEKPSAEVKDTVQPGSLTATIADSATFSTLTKALKAAELDALLGARGEFTVFAPTDEAFGKLPAKVLTELLLPENKEQLRSLLLYHVIAGRMPAADLQNGELKTLNGEKVRIDTGNDRIEIDGATDLVAINGVIHSLSRVLVPESLDEFAGLKN